MSSTTLNHLRTPVPGRPARPSGSGLRRQTLATAIRVEWIKLRTLRSTWVGLATTVVVTVGFGAIAAAVSGSVPDDGRGAALAGQGAVTTVLTGATFGVLLLGIFGALAGAREFSSRMIAATVTAVPRRWQVGVAKSVVFGAAALVTSLVAVLGAFVVGMALLASQDLATVGLLDDGVLRQVLGMAGYLTAAGLIGVGLGVLLRNVAGAIGVIVAGLLVLPPLAGALLPDSWAPLLQYLPSSAAAAFTTVQAAGGDVLSPLAGALVLLAWVAAVLGGAVVALSRRDV